MNKFRETTGRVRDPWPQQLLRLTRRQIYRYYSSTLFISANCHSLSVSLVILVINYFKNKWPIPIIGFKFPKMSS